MESASSTRQVRKSTYSPDETNRHFGMLQRPEKPRCSSRYRKAHRPMSNMTNLYSKGLRDMKQAKQMENVRNLSVSAISFGSNWCDICRIHFFHFMFMVRVGSRLIQESRINAELLLAFNTTPLLPCSMNWLSLTGFYNRFISRCRESNEKRSDWKVTSPGVMRRDDVYCRRMWKIESTATSHTLTV